MLFGDSFKLIMDGKTCMWLPHWRSDVRIRVQRPDEHSKMSAPYLYVESKYGSVPWIPTQIELFSTGWQVHGIKKDRV